MLIFITAVMAADVQLGFGPEMTLNDPFLGSAGVRLDATVRPLSWFGVGLSATALPVQTGQPALTVMESYDIVPDIVYPWGRAAAMGQLRVAHARFGAWETDVHLGLGVGGVYTVDACGTYIADGPKCHKTQKEVHPTSVVGLAGSVGRDRWAIVVRMERTAYTETVLDTYKERKRHLWAGAALRLTFGKAL